MDAARRLTEDELIGEAPPPIIVVGAARSGTHLLASSLARILPCTYIGDANHIWRGIAHVPTHDAYPATLATPKAVERIRRRFSKLCNKTGEPLLIEKTAANVLRLSFVRRVYPNARLIYIYRDGRDVAVSALRKMQGDHRKQTNRGGSRGPLWSRVQRLLREIKTRFDTGLTPLQILRDWRRNCLGVASFIGLKKNTIWGPRYPGAEQAIATTTPLLAAATQWRYSVEAAKSFFDETQPEGLIVVRYEDFIQTPIESLTRIVTKICPDLDRGNKIKQVAGEIRPGTRPWRAGLSIDVAQGLESHLADTLLDLGYAVNDPDCESR